MERGIRLIGNGQAPVHMYWDKLLQYIREGKTDPYIMLSHRVLMEELDLVYDVFNKREDHMQKVFVQTKFSDPPAPGTPAVTSYKK